MGAQERASGTEYAFWSGGNFADGHIVGLSEGTRLIPMGLVWAPVLGRYRHFTVRYRMDAIPAAFLHDDRLTPPRQLRVRGMHWVYGAGFSPVGMQIDFRPRARFRPFFEVTAGFLYFTSKVLAYGGTQFNFTAAPGAGVHIALSPRTALILGYKYHHMSNANLNHQNPGVDSEEVYGGISLFRW
ncbi:MAG TPA: acyloxyacyl hydrolase [Terriglobales bacterium]|nr:acyloxyacyl hydrolase [Terriglobales bacterium]